MTYRLSMTVVGYDPVSGKHSAIRSIVTTIVGCTDAEDAKAKARTLYQIVRFKSVELAK